MNEAAATLSAARPQGPRAILWAGLIAGTMDLTAALIQSGLRGRTPESLLQAIASGVLGEKAFDGGAPAAALGAVLHYVIAFGAATVFYLASRKLDFLVRRPVVSGLAYGVAVYVFMNFIVLPLSAIPFQISRAPALVATGVLILMFCIGLPIALVVRRFSGDPASR